MSTIRQEILKAHVAELKTRWDRLTEKLKLVTTERDRETRSTEKMRLDAIIAETKADRDRIEDELQTKERELKMLTENQSGSVEVFYSYSHKDQELRDKLITHLSLLKRQNVIDAWHDGNIEAGQEWDVKIKKHLESAKIILLLVSADFLASDYIHDVEIKRAMERHESGGARVIPVILRPCDCTSALFGKLQALPTGGRPVTNWHDQDEAFLNIAQGIRAVAEDLAA